MALSITPGPLPSADTASLARAALSSTFGVPFYIWRRGNDGWSPAVEQIGAEACDCPELQDLLEEAIDQPQPIVHIATLRGGETILVAPGGGDSSWFAIVGRVQLNAAELAVRAASLAVRQADWQLEYDRRQALLDQYAVRLSSAFEELAFMRRLCHHVEVCVGTRGLGDVAQAILPQLQELTGLEGLCLIQAETNPLTRSLRPKAVVGWSGAVRAGNQFLVDLLVDEAVDLRKVIVKNHLKPCYQGIGPGAGLRSIVIVPVQKDKEVYGWLMGINRRHVTDEVNCPENSLGTDEIGSMEASLLEAAAVLLAAHSSNHQLLKERESLFVDVVHTLVGVIEAKDAYTCGHSDRVAQIAKRLSEQLGLTIDECEEIYLAGLLHDIGKIGIADDVLLKPGRLSEEEFNILKRHPTLGAQLLQGLRPLERLIPGVLHHHEALDGSGYPDGLKGNAIPLMARILAVADAFDAMTSDRPYRPGMDLAKAESILRDGAGKQWDRAAVDAYFSARNDVLDICIKSKGRLSVFEKQLAPQAQVVSSPTIRCELPPSRAIASPCSVASCAPFALTEAEIPTLV